MKKYKVEILFKNGNTIEIDELLMKDETANEVCNAIIKCYHEHKTIGLQLGCILIDVGETACMQFIEVEDNSSSQYGKDIKDWSFDFKEENKNVHDNNSSKN